MFDALQQWVALVLFLRNYTFSRGAWVETPVVASLFIASIRHFGGPAPLAEDRRQRFQIFLLGPRDMRAAGVDLLADANLLVSAAIQGILPCGAANVRASTEPVGPAYTVEGRAWVQVDFEVLF